jgi:hypothetical protein
MITRGITKYRKDTGFDKIIEKLSKEYVIGSKSNAREIVIEKVTIKQSEQFMTLCLKIQLCFNLNTINIHDCKFIGDTWDVLLSHIVKCPTLAWLFLTHDHLDDTHVQSIVDSLNQWKSLVCLNLTDNRITQKGAKKLCDNIFMCPTLTMLTIDNNYTDINKQISLNIQDNIDRINRFHNITLNLQFSECSLILSFYPTLVDSFNKGVVLLHHLVINEIYIEMLIKLLKYNPNPYHEDINFSKIPIEIAVGENTNILKEYMDYIYQSQC